jgi:hypothetical protein
MKEPQNLEDIYVLDHRVSEFIALKPIKERRKRRRKKKNVRVQPLSCTKSRTVPIVLKALKQGTQSQTR